MRLHPDTKQVIRDSSAEDVAFNFVAGMFLYQHPEWHDEAYGRDGQWFLKPTAMRALVNWTADNGGNDKQLKTLYASLTKIESDKPLRRGGES